MMRFWLKGSSLLVEAVLATNLQAGFLEKMPLIKPTNALSLWERAGVRGYKSGSYPLTLYVNGLIRAS